MENQGASSIDSHGQERPPSNTRRLSIAPLWRRVQWLASRAFSSVRLPAADGHQARNPNTSLAPSFQGKVLNEKPTTGKLVNGTVWTVGAFGAGQIIRLGTNIVLARLLAPELFGLMLIVHTVRNGVELLSDVGIGQNIIYSKNADEPEFYNTAWTLQLIRGVVLWVVILIASPSLAQFYAMPVLNALIPITSLMVVISGFASVGPQLLQKKLAFARINLFQLAVAICSTVIFVVLAYISRTIWALVVGSILTSLATTVGSYLLVPELKQKFLLNKRFVSEIINFGKWVSLSSAVYFLSRSFDGLYFAKVVPLEVLGVYGIARSMSDLLGLLASRLGNSVVFPFIASHSNTPRASLHGELAHIRVQFLLLAALGCSLFVATADLAIRLLYDQRYQAAAWILPVLIVASWFSVVTSLNESTLLGLGAPSYMAISNSLKLVLLLFGLPLSFKLGGLAGAVIILPVIEASRYVPLYIGQMRQRFSFGAQDLSLTISMFLMIGLWEGLRWISGFGTSFDTLPIRELVGVAG
jgi:O-antigen/teichoic acid export membrane protein